MYNIPLECVIHINWFAAGSSPNIIGWGINTVCPLHMQSLLLYTTVLLYYYICVTMECNCLYYMYILYM